MLAGFSSLMCRAKYWSIVSTANLSFSKICSLSMWDVRNQVAVYKTIIVHWLVPILMKTIYHFQDSIVILSGFPRHGTHKSQSKETRLQQAKKSKFLSWAFAIFLSIWDGSYLVLTSWRFKQQKNDWWNVQMHVEKWQSYIHHLYGLSRTCSARAWKWDRNVGANFAILSNWRKHKHVATFLIILLSFNCCQTSTTKGDIPLLHPNRA